LGLSQVGLVGHDWGGWTGFLACMREPSRFGGFLALGILPPFQPRDPARLLQVWRGWYQVALSLPVLSGAALRRTPAVVERVLRGGSVRMDAFTEEDLRLYGEVLQEPSRARATVQLYRTFLLKEAAGVMAGRYRGTSLTVPTRLVGGSGDPVITPGLLRGLEGLAEPLTVEVIEGVGHFLPEEAPELVAD
jgi:pimeloyl-ACP methyl ester carboxylesterase